MPHLVIYNSESRYVLVIDPQCGEDGRPILPLDVPTAAVAELSDAEMGKFQQAGSFTLAADGETIVVTPPTAAPPDPRVQAIAAIKSDPHFQQFTPEAQQAFLMIAGGP